MDQERGWAGSSTFLIKAFIRARSIFLIASVCCSNASRGKPNSISGASLWHKVPLDCMASRREDRAAALSSRLLAMQSNGTLCQRLAPDILFGLPLEAFEQQTDAIRNMDLARMNAFIRKVLDPAQPRSWSIVRPPAGE